MFSLLFGGKMKSPPVARQHVKRNQKDRLQYKLMTAGAVEESGPILQTMDNDIRHAPPVEGKLNLDYIRDTMMSAISAVGRKVSTVGQDTMGVILVPRDKNVTVLFRAANPERQRELARKSSGGNHRDDNTVSTPYILVTGRSIYLPSVALGHRPLLSPVPPPPCQVWILGPETTAPQTQMWAIPQYREK
jgi:hypothetical protein